MPRRSKGARLWLRERKGREPVYVILDGSDEVSTGCGPDDVEGANQALQRHLAARFKPDTRQRDLAAISCAEVLMMYGRDLPADSPSRATIGYHIKALLPFWGEKTLADVKGSTCRKYVASRSTSARSVKASTSRQELKTFQAAINHWHRESPLAAVPRVTLPEPGGRRERVLERNEVAAMLRAARRLKLNHVVRFVLIGVYTGTRHNAILTHRWGPSLHGGHVDLGRGIIYRRGSADRETSKRRPPVRIPTRLFGHLSRWARTAGADSDTIVHYQGQRIAKMKRAWATVVKAAGLGPDVTPHVLRHTCASWLLWGRPAKGARPATAPLTVWDVAGIIGADASTIERVYGHHRNIELERKRA